MEQESTFRLRKVLLITAGVLLSLVLLLLFLIRFPAVQSWLVHKSELVLESVLHAEVDLEEVSIALPAEGRLNGITISSDDGGFQGEISSVGFDLLNFSLWDYLFNSKPVHVLNISTVRVDGLDLPLVRDSSGHLNLLSIIPKSGGSSKKSRRLLKIDIDEVSVTNASFSYLDSLRLPADSIQGTMFTATDMKIDSIQLDASFSAGPGKRVNVDIRHLSAIERNSGLTLRDFSLGLISDTLQITDRRGWKEVVPYVSITGLKLQEGLTDLHVDLRYPRTELMDLLRGDLLYRYFEADWYPSTLHTSSIQKFTPRELPIEGLLRLQGKTIGTIDDLYSTGLHVEYGDSTFLNARFRIDNLLSYEDTKLDIRLRDSRVQMSELYTFIPALEIPYLTDTTVLRAVNGRFVGHYLDFSVNTRGELGTGTFQEDLAFTLPPRSKTMRYEGSVSVNRLNPVALGFESVLDSRDLTATAIVDGKGTSIATLATALDLRLRDSDLYGYRVDSILADLDVRQKVITGSGQAYHAGGSGDVKVDMNLGATPATYGIFGGVRKVDLNTYGLWESPLIVSTRFVAEFEGDSLEEVEGLFRLAESSVTNEEGRAFNLYQSTLEVSRNQSGEKIFGLQSPVADVDLKGNFTLKKLGGLMGRLARESQLYFSNDDSTIQSYYQEKVVDSLASTSGTLALKSNQELNQLMEFLLIPLDISRGSVLSADFSFDLTDNVTTSFSSDSIRYNGITFEGVTSEGTVFKQSTDNVLALLAGLNITRANLGGGHFIDRLSWEVDGADDTFHGLLIMQQIEENNLVQLRTNTYFRSDGSILSELDHNSTHFVVNRDSLDVMAGNEIILNEGVLDIRNILLQSDATYFRLDGLVSKDPRDVLTFQVGQLPVEILTDFTDVSFLPEGMFNLEVNMQQLLTDPCLSLVSRLDEFTLDGYEYGTIFTDGHWQSSTQHLQLDASLFDGRDTTLHAIGYYDMGDTLAPLHFGLGTENGFPFDYAYPFVRTQLYELQGVVDLDQFTITGSLGKPVVLGTGHFTNAGFGVDYFKTKYTFDGSITFDNDKIEFPRIRLYDVNRRYAQLYGFIYHNGLSDFRFDLQLEEADNFLLMNTRKGDNELFYGRLLLKDGLGSVTGDLEKLSLDMFATSGRGSFLKIPLEDTGAEGRPDFIVFSGEEKSSDTYETGLKDFEINLNIAMTEDLEVDLIFDEKVGDIIRGKGVGNLSMYINEAGEFTMFGDYEIREGNYLFTAQNILNKKFLVKPGGTIVWTGDPYNAQLKLDAYYPLYADISQLLQEDQPIRTPVNVNMGMVGSLLEPEIVLSIELPSLTEGDASQIASYLKSIQYDEQELNKQVFSLMVFNRFAPVGGFLGDNVASSGVTTSISELISNQLNYWLGQAIGENVNVGLATNNFQDVNLLLSASLFDDRVIIERDGTLIDDNSNLAIGNVSIQIKLLPAAGQVLDTEVRPSELVLEVFTRESLDANLNNNTYQAGVGIFYKKDFDRIGDLLKRNRR